MLHCYVLITEAILLACGAISDWSLPSLALLYTLKKKPFSMYTYSFNKYILFQSSHLVIQQLQHQTHRMVYWSLQHRKGDLVQRVVVRYLQVLYLCSVVSGEAIHSLLPCLKEDNHPLMWVIIIPYQMKIIINNFNFSTSLKKVNHMCTDESCSPRLQSLIGKLVKF